MIWTLLTPSSSTAYRTTSATSAGEGIKGMGLFRRARASNWPPEKQYWQGFPAQAYSQGQRHWNATQSQPWSTAFPAKGIPEEVFCA